MYQLKLTEGAARRGALTTVHGTVQTPAFMNVATAAAIKGGISAYDLKELKCQVMLCNTYHLHLRPGDNVVRQLGGLHRFTGWQGPILTDSGGFQVFSLASLRHIEEKGVTFASHIDGHRIFMGPEESMQIQSNLGSDICMAFDECIENPAPYDYVARSVDRTYRWLVRCKAENARLNALVVEGGKLGRSRLFDSKNLSRVPDVKVVPDAEDAALLLANVRGVKGNRENWPGAAHLVSIMAQMDDNIARQVVEDMKKNVGRYSKEKYSMMVTLLAKSSSPAMRDMLKDLYASISESKNKKIQDKQAVVLKYMRFAMKLDDLDDVMKILQKKDASPDLISSAFRTARYLIDEAPPAKRKALSSKLLQYQKDMPEENVKRLYKLLARTGDPKVLDMMEKSYKEDTKKALAIITAWGDWNTDDAVPYLFKAWKDESLHERVRSQAHDSILRVLSVDRDRDDNATLKLFDPLIADAKTSERRQFLVAAFKRLSNRPYVIRLLGRIKQTAEDQRNAVEPKFQAAEEALFKAEDKFKANPGDAAAKADYEAKEKIYNELSSQKTGEDKVIAAVDKALEKVRKTPVPTRKAASAEDRDDDDSSVIKTI